jgi:acetyl-CoA acyltransferase
MQAAYIIAGYRTAVGKAKRGGFRFYRPDDLAVDVIRGLLASVPELDPKLIDDVIVGNAVPEAEQGLQVGRIIANYYLSMGLTAEQVASDYKVSREDQDAFAYASHQKAIKAIAEGYFKKGILPITVPETYLNEKGKKATREAIVDTDEGPRADTSMQVLAKLPSVFAQGGSVTAGNSSQTSDGAAFVIVMSERLMNSLGLKPWGRLINYACAGVDPRIMGMGPVAAIPKALKQAGMTLADIDLIELNEAFASQSIAVIRELGIDPAKVNINGGAIALGHPLGCSGAKLTIQILNDMERLGKRYGMVTACVGGGQGIAGLIELMH